MAGYRVLDIETVVDPRYWDRPSAKWVEKPLDPPIGSTFAAGVPMIWEREEPFPPPQAHRVVAMAWVDLSGDDGKWYSLESTTKLCDWDYKDGGDEVERSLLEAFKRAQEGDEACLVTWNGRTFDLPVINLRSFLHGIACEWYYKERDLRYRYSEACHCDLMDFFTDFGASRAMKLGDVARLVGLPGKIGEVKGASVGEIYEAYRPTGRGVVSRGPFGTLAAAKEAVGAYCLLDALQTAVLFGRSRVHKGMIDRDYYDRIVAPSFADALTATIADVRRSRA